MNRKRALSLPFVCAPQSRSYHIHTKSHTCTHNSSLKFITTFQITAFITKPTIQLLTVSNMSNDLAAAYVVLSANKSSAPRTVRFSQYNLFIFFYHQASLAHVCVANSTSILFYIIYLRSNHQIQTWIWYSIKYIEWLCLFFWLNCFRQARNNKYIVFMRYLQLINIVCGLNLDRSQNLRI